MSAPEPGDERARLAALRRYEVLDTLPEQAYDDITYVASLIAGTPIALVSLIDRDRQWFKSRVGLAVPETSRDLAFCAHAIMEPDDLFVVPDARRDERFANNPLVTADPQIRFYAGAPLVTSDGAALGTLCVIDRVPRELTADQQEALRALSRQVMAQLELRRTLAELRRQSTTDSLTGTMNRRAFETRLDEEYDRAVRYRSPLSLALLDVDDFKAYNDSFGHPEGDEVLRTLARVMTEQCRSSDLIARYGGEEFVVILPNTARDDALVLAERYRRAIEQHGWERRAITISLGVSTFPDTARARRAHRSGGRGAVRLQARRAQSRDAREGPGLR